MMALGEAQRKSGISRWLRRIMAMLVALAIPAIALTIHGIHGSADTAVVGTTTVYSPVAKNAPGVAQVYRFKARSGGRVNRLNIYLHGTSTASRVTLGLYSGSASRALERGRQCTMSSPQAGAWNRCSFAAYKVRAGAYYWLALLQPASSRGRLQYREGRRSGGPVTYLSKRKRMSSLPSRWTNGASGRGGYQASIYASGGGALPPVGGPPVATPPGGGSTPSPSQSGFPDASNTGVPPGTTLTRTGALNITQAGAVIDGVDAPSVEVNAPNVTIRNSRIHSRSAWLVQNKSTGLVIEDSEVDGEGSNSMSIGSSNFTLRRVEITGSENGMDIGAAGNVTVEDCYIHDLTTSGGAHTDGAQFGEGAHDILFRHNWISPSPQDGGSPPATSAIIMWDEGGTQNTRVRIEDNVLDGSHASVALYAPRQPASDIYINGNRMRRGVGYTNGVDVPRTVTEFHGNVDHDSGKPVHEG
jgi:hypothetical protein